MIKISFAVLILVIDNDKFCTSNKVVSTFFSLTYARIYTICKCINKFMYSSRTRIGISLCARYICFNNEVASIFALARGENLRTRETAQIFGWHCRVLSYPNNEIMYSCHWQRQEIHIICTFLSLPMARIHVISLFAYFFVHVYINRNNVNFHTWQEFQMLVL